MKKLRFLVSMTFMLGMCVSMYANPDVTGKKKEKKGDVGTTITLVTSGTGDTKEDAIKNALRSALEQTYGAFVSANSQVVNDELVKDEIVSISTGNIVSYEELSFIDSNPKQVSVSAVVSISRLQSYAQNKGMSAELAGNTFAMNMKMEELNKKNQDVALQHLLLQTKIMAQKLFDYEIILGNPQKTSKGVIIPVTIQIKANDNTVSYYDYFHKTLTSLAVKKKTGKDASLHGEEGIEIPGMEQVDNKAIAYVLRGGDTGDVHNTLHNLREVLEQAIVNFEVVDNIGNVSSLIATSGYNFFFGGSRRYMPNHKLTLEGDGSSKQLLPRRNEYTRLSPNQLFPNYHWMNTIKPQKGEILFDGKLFLLYTTEEIAKINKIEIRPLHIPSKEEKEAVNALYNDFIKADKLFSDGRVKIYGGGSYESRRKAAEECYKNATDLLKKIQSNPKSRSVPNLYDSINEKLKEIERYMRKL